MLWTLPGSLRDRMVIVAEAGLSSVGFVSEPSRWTAAETGAAQKLLEELELRPTIMSGTPGWRSRGVSMIDPAQRPGLLSELEASARLARRLEVPRLLLMAGTELEGVRRATQMESLIESCKRCAEVAEGYDLTLALEPLNRRLDHPGYFLTDCRDGAEVIRAVDSPRLRLVFDVYHQQTDHGDALAALRETISLTSVIHLADAPGRHEPGLGDVDWQALCTLVRDRAFSGELSYEYLPAGDAAASLRRADAVVREAA